MSNNNNNDIKVSNYPKDIKFLKNITKDSYSNCLLDNTFILFNSINGILYLIYSSENKSIISYNLNNNKKLTEIKKAHNDYISNFRHYLDIIIKRDLLISISCYENNIKLWDINNWDILLNIKNINKTGYLNSACFLKDNFQNYIITSNINYTTSELIKVYDFNGTKIKEISDSNETTFFIDSFYDNKLSKNYIITGNNGKVKSYDFYKNKVYHIYSDNENNNKGHSSIVICNIEEIIKLIESSYDGSIRIWNFHSGDLLKKIKVSKEWLRGICLWNKDYIFVGCDDKSIKLIDLNKGRIDKNLIGHYNDVLTLKKIVDRKFGECLISQGWKNDQIKLWAI